MKLPKIFQHEAFKTYDPSVIRGMDPLRSKDVFRDIWRGICTSFLSSLTTSVCEIKVEKLFE